MRIAIIGLGYIGLPLALEFSKEYQVLSEEYQDLLTDRRIIFDLKIYLTLLILMVAYNLNS